MNYLEAFNAVSTIPSFGEFDGACLYDFLVAEAPRGSGIAEIGNFHGRSLIYLALRAKATDKNLRIYGIDWGRGMTPDSPTTDALDRNLRQFGVRDLVTTITKPTDEAAKDFEDNSLFAVMVDDDHTPEGARLSLRSWIPKVQRGGWVTGHDFYWWGPFEAVQELCPYCVNGPTKNFFYGRKP